MNNHFFFFAFFYILEITHGNNASTVVIFCICGLTSDLQQINHLIINPQLKESCSKYCHGIFMYELSVCHNTENAWREKNDPRGSFMAPGFIRQGWNGRGEGESVSFNRHLGFDSC